MAFGNGYRGPDPARIAGQQRAHHLAFAGQVATWRRYVSASAGNAYALAAGLGSAPSYREQTITALFGPVMQPEGQSGPAGLFAQAEIMATTTERLGRQDELVWNGVVYRVESDAAPAAIAGTWTVTLKRGK